MSIIIFSGCESENLEELYPCKEQQISYSKDIVPILQQNCYRCHSDNNADTFGQSIYLENYADVVFMIEAQGTTVEERLVYGNIAQLPGFVPMPGASLPKINECSIQKMRIWIEEGYPNN